MKKFQKLLGLCLIGSLLAVHPISSVERSLVQRISEKVQKNPQGAALAGALLLGIAAYTWNTSAEGSTLRALPKYLLNTPELRVRKGASAASLALAYAAHRYSKSKPVSAIAGLVLLISLYSVCKDISLVKDVQLAKAGKEVSDEHIKRYMDSLCFNRKMSQGFVEEPGSAISYSEFDFEDNSCFTFDQKKLQDKFFSVCKENEDYKGQLQRCAQQLLQEKGFVAREFEEFEQLKGQWDRGGWLRVNRANQCFHQQWIAELKMLHRVIHEQEDAFSLLKYMDYDGKNIPKDFMVKLYRSVAGEVKTECRNVKRANEG